VYGYFAAGVLYGSGLWKATMTVPAPTGEEFRADELDDWSGDLLHDEPPAGREVSASSSTRASKSSSS
jgi:hypothetical protein